MKLFPAKISEPATLQKSMTSEGNSVLLPTNVYAREIYFHKFVHEKVFSRGLCDKCDKSLKDWSLGKQLILFPEHLNVFRGHRSRDQSFSV